MKRSEAFKLRAAMETAATSLDDKTASTAATMYPRLKGNGALVKAGTRIFHEGKLLRAAVDLWDTAENSPENAPTLWEEIQYLDGYRIIPETLTAGTAFAKGECGWWKDELYESLIDSNVWTPEAYAAGWEKK